MPKKLLPPDAKRRTIWISDALWARIERASTADERTVSAWIRRVIERALK